MHIWTQTLVMSLLGVKKNIANNTKSYIHLDKPLLNLNLNRYKTYVVEIIFM
jgi:hypothetical protein